MGFPHSVFFVAETGANMAKITRQNAKSVL